MVDVTPTRGAALELTEERKLIEVGFEFLDEKRVLLAKLLLEELRAWQAVQGEAAKLLDRARDAAKAAVARHGLEGARLYPTNRATPPDAPIQGATTLGIATVKAPDFDWPVQLPRDAPDASVQAEDCAAAFAALVPLYARIAAHQLNIHQLLRDYRRTERRARALENVLLPEIRKQLSAMTEYLDEADQEEAVRIHNAAARGHAGPGGGQGGVA